MNITPSPVPAAASLLKRNCKKPSPGYIIIAFCTILFFASCSKDKVDVPPPDNPLPEMTYVELGNREIVLGGDGALIDLTGDNRADILFDLYLIGDAINMTDKWTWTIVTGRYGYLPVNTEDQLPVMKKGDVIPVGNFKGYEWWVANEIVLMQRFENQNGSISWGGQWLDAQNSYLPLSLLKDGNRYNGWIELSASTTGQKLILHRAGISKSPNTAIKAGI